MSGPRQRRVVDVLDAQCRGTSTCHELRHQTRDVVAPSTGLGVVHDAQVAFRRHARHSTR